MEGPKCQDVALSCWFPRSACSGNDTAVNTIDKGETCCWGFPIVFAYGSATCFAVLTEFYWIVDLDFNPRVCCVVDLQHVGTRVWRSSGPLIFTLVGSSHPRFRPEAASSASYDQGNCLFANSPESPRLRRPASFKGTKTHSSAFGVPKGSSKRPSPAFVEVSRGRRQHFGTTGS